MHVKLTKHFEIDPEIRNYDHSKFAVYTNAGAYLTNIYKHNKVFYSLYENTRFESIENCVESLNNHIKVKETEKKREYKKRWKR